MEQRQAQAGLALSGALFALALAAPAIEPDVCRSPVESVAVEQHTTAVRCEAPQARARELRGPARRLFGLPIELNCAGARTLETLGGIGSVRARRIVEERAREPFERVDDLLRVHGLGPKTLENLRSAVAANPRTRKSGSVDFPECRSEGVREF
ncbi:MAG: ComEA family DNA-binding protein [Myxococcota bacterium]